MTVIVRDHLTLHIYQISSYIVQYTWIKYAMTDKKTDLKV